MSIQIKNLTKLYDRQKALDDISFSVASGEIVGFLGPNGAGKSTTMKIATGFIPATTGTVHVDGLDIRTHALKVKRRIGYLPEHNPLYLDMYVHEYLGFVGATCGLTGRVLRDRVGEMVERCGLTREQNKRIESLSKGYRQRVGFAQALLHNPSVLILDEPTSGLDPNQLVEIRQLIRSAGKDKTVLFSTHILQEVQALCDRVVVINKGTIVADDLISNLMKQGTGRTSVRVEFEGPVEATALRQLQGVEHVHQEGPGIFILSGKEAVDLRPAIFQFAAGAGLSLIGLRQKGNSLEDIFKGLTANETVRQ
ncbi:MAG: gliding motility-associated ABC transporter ATP-binding subunit GldA [Cyclobacteriaceae bacterium]|nr:gliding motility-associated ABC transporter ATP-binding subunit GldA [Cyclobacteriaceae bacterium]